MLPVPRAVHELAEQVASPAQSKYADTRSQKEVIAQHLAMLYKPDPLPHSETASTQQYLSGDRDHTFA